MPYNFKGKRTGKITFYGSGYLCQDDEEKIKEKKPVENRDIIRESLLLDHIDKFSLEYRICNHSEVI